MANLTVKKREGTGKYVAFNLRKNGEIPGVLYGKEVENVNLAVPLKPFNHLLHEGERIVELDIEGTEQMALIKDVQHGTFDHEILHADFRAIDATTTLNVEINIELTGEAKGLEEGGVMAQNTFSVEVECLPHQLPDNIEVDVSDMTIGDTIYVSDLPKLEGVTYMTDPELAVVSCTTPMAEEPEEGEEEAADAAEGAAAEPEVIGEKEREEDAAEKEEG